MRSAHLLLAGEDLELLRRLLADPGEDLLAVRGLADGARDEGQQLLDALVLGDLEALLDERHEPVGPAVLDPAVVEHVLGEPQVDLVRGGRQRVRAGVGVDDEEMDGVRSHVDDPEPHGSQAYGP